MAKFLLDCENFVNKIDAITLAWILTNNNYNRF